MDWSDVAETVGQVAPAAGGALYGPLGAAVGRVIAEKLGVEQSPQAVNAAVQTDPEAAVKLREIEAGAAASQAQERTKRLEAINATMRAELESKSPLKSGWRGATGWVFMLSCAGVTSSIVWAMFQPGSDKPELLGHALVMFGIMATVLGIDINRAGRERLATLGQRPDSFMDAIKARVAR